MKPKEPLNHEQPTDTSVTRRGLITSMGGLAIAPKLPADKRRRSLGMGSGLLGSRSIDLAIATITRDGFCDEDFQYAFADIPKLGIQNVEFNCWYPRCLSPAGIESIKSRCRKANLRPVAIQGVSLVGDEGENRLREVGRLLWTIEACKRLGCRIIKCTGAERDTRGGLQGLIAMLKILVPALEEAGVILCLENHFKNVLQGPDDYDQIFDAIDSPALGIAFDPAHFNAAGVDLHALIERFSSRIYHVDLKNNEGPGAHKVCAYDKGAVDLRAMIQQLIDTGYRGYLVVEMARADRSVTLADLSAGRDLGKAFVR